MKIKLIGLGKMGYNLMLNMKDHGIEVEGYDIVDDIRAKATQEGFIVHNNLKDLFTSERNIVWVMLCLLKFIVWNSKNDYF